MDDDGSPLEHWHMGIRRFFSKGKSNNTEDVTEEEIKSMVLEGHEQGVLQESEAEMISNIFTLDEKEAKDIMTHRKNIEAVSETITVRELLKVIEDNGYSRYPVFRDDIDNVIGVIHIKDVIPCILKTDVMDRTVVDVPDLIREIPFIPETRNIDVLFKNMQSQKTHIVIVVDEYGQTAGLVTMEDILEEIVGNILDEHDEEEQMIIRESDHSYLVKGMAELDELCPLLGLPEEVMEDFDTLNGFLIAQIDKIPNDGELFKVTVYGYLFEVLGVKDKMIQNVRVTRIDDQVDTVPTEKNNNQ